MELSIVIDETGKITDYKIRRSTHGDFTRAVLKVIKQWKFRPAMKDGRKVAVRKIQPFEFSAR